MSCSNPMIAIKEKSSLTKTGYRVRFFSKYRPDKAVHLKERYGDSLLFLPCGHCESCKLAYRKDWSVRCEMESLLHRDSCFLTLTLDDLHIKPLPLKEDLQYFLHKLRDSYGIKCRYFACGELGSKSNRAHYHMILFGYKPDDLKFYGFSKSGEYMFTSKFLTKVWDKGLVTIQDFNIANASYVAGYVKKDKKQTFIMESTRPGLGRDYMVSNLHQLFKYGKYQGKNGQVHRLPRYFDKVCDQLGYDTFHLKEDSKEMMDDLNKSSKFNLGIFQDVNLFAHQGVIMRDKLKKMKRGL